MYEWNNYMYQLQQNQQLQNEKIKELEERVFKLEKKIQENNSLTVDKIEYHFDQLKIERLDGTLHIGLSPNELANIDDLGIPTVKQSTVVNPVNQQLVPQLNQFVNERGPKMIRELAQKYKKPIDHKLEGDIIHDILGQIPDRIQFYENEAREKHQINHPQQLESFISDHIQKEVYHSLQRFIEKSEDQKGES
ncbi:spore germination protein GerPC [Paucisalibacillus sp. EB02]|uniref:spore germination protein GerPC n=1 Tax=Paucisalibacillus sp. EB02 TaxID=1347087 RepID=UPI00069364F7|nr:spore germination protein GerPC [Paucisalibacillus sp. EB02]